MKPQGRIWLTDAEVATTRAALRGIDEVTSGLWVLPPDQHAAKIASGIESVRYLLERAEARRGVH